MNHYKETSETWNKIAALYQDKFMDLDLYNTTYDFFCDVLPENAKVLDVGCGPGNITRYLLSKRPDLQMEGIDVAPDMVSLAQKNNPQAHFRIMDSRDVSQLTSRFEGIVCGFCLPYLTPTDADTFITDTFDLLKKDGVFYLSFVEGKPSDSGFKTGSSGDRVYFHYYELEILTQQLVAAGFEQPQIFKVNYHTTAEGTDVHTILVTRKT